MSPWLFNVFAGLDSESGNGGLCGRSEVRIVLCADDVMLLR